MTREKWLLVAGPLVAMIALLMGATALSLKNHRPHARITFMLIWPLIIIYGVACAGMQAVPWNLGLRAVIDATFVAAIASWLLFKYKASRQYFSDLQS